MFNHEPSDYTCPFCNLISGNETDYNTLQDVVFETEHVLAFVSPKWWPNNPGNILIIPKEHYENIYDIPDSLLSEIAVASKKLSLAIKTIYKCDGTSTRQHNEPDGGQDVWHYHLHVFPRWKGDSLYQNHENKKFVPANERVIYANKLRAVLQEQ